MEDVFGVDVDERLDHLPHVVLDLRLGQLRTAAKLLLQILGKNTRYAFGAVLQEDVLVGLVFKPVVEVHHIGVGQLLVDLDLVHQLSRTTFTFSFVSSYSFFLGRILTT